MSLLQRIKNLIKLSKYDISEGIYQFKEKIPEQKMAQIIKRVKEIDQFLNE